MSRDQLTLTNLARLGFTELGAAGERIGELGLQGHLSLFAHAANPDQALWFLGRLQEQAPKQLGALLKNDEAASRLIQVVGASQGLGEFLVRRPSELAALAEPLSSPPSAEHYRADLLGAVD